MKQVLLKSQLLNIQTKKILTCLLSCDLVLIVVEILSTKQEAEFGVVLLLSLGHLFKLRAIASHKLGQLVYDILQLLVCK